MFTFIDSGDAGYSLQLNVMLQTLTRSAYWISGGGITPGTSSTDITVAVSAGEATITGTPVSWADEELILADAGMGPNGQPTNNPRVDVISATSNGALSATTGEPAPYAPDTDANGNPLTPQEFEHWEPAPDDGQRVGGAVLGLVLVKPNFGSAQDLTSACIDNDWKFGPGEVSQFVYGNGQDNGDVTITTANSDFIARDPADAQPNYLWKDESTGTLKLGSPDAQPTLQENLDAEENDVAGVGTLHFSQNAEQTVSIDTANGGVWELHDRNPGGNSTPDGGPNPIVISDRKVFFSRQADFNGGNIVDVNSIGFSTGTTAGPLLDISNDPNGRQELWRHTDAENNPKEFVARSNPGGQRVFEIENVTDSQVLFYVHENGDIFAPNGQFI